MRPNVGKRDARGLPPLLSELTLPAPVLGSPDGEGDGGPQSISALATAAQLSFERLEPAPPTAHPVVCDIVPYHSALYVSHATSIINRAGARIHRYDPYAAEGQRWSLVFDYDGHGRGGQGLPRVRSIGNRLVAVDGDSTSAGFFGLGRDWAETYLFSSDDAGVFSPAIVDDTVPAGTRAAAMAFHLFDAIDYAGALITTGGMGVRDDRTDTWLAAVWAGDPNDVILSPRYRIGGVTGVLRTTYMHRFGGRLYIGFQNNERRARFDLAVLGGDPRDDDTPAPVVARITPDGGWLTRRFASGGGALYWVASGYRGDGRPGRVFRSTDGATFSAVALPEAAGDAQDVAIGDGAVFVLTSTGLYRGNGDGAGWKLVAPAPAGDPFGRFEPFCSAPLVAFDGALYAGSTRDGGLYRIAAR